MAEETYVLELKGITKVFPGVHALKGVDLRIKPGEVHALVGENGAGKSTLMKTILGIHRQTDGEMFFKGKPYQPHSPADALGAGISMIHQEISLIPSISVSENIWMGRESQFGNRFFINKAKQEKAAEKILLQMGLNIAPSTIVEKLTIAQMQMVEIARAVSYDSDVIIMDEPTSALTDAEVDKLFNIIRDLKSKGKSVIFISHKLEEVFTICDTVTVLRDGTYIKSMLTSETNNNELITLMVGRTMNDVYPKETVEIGAPYLEVRNFSQTGVFKNVNFTVHRGEILGFAGLVGAGRTEIMSAIFGVDPHESGEILLDGKPVVIHNATDAVDNGLSMVTEDRLHTGAIYHQTVKFNASIAYLRSITRHGFVDSKQEEKDVLEMSNILSLKTDGLGMEIDKLSGGNQQKVIITKWMLTNPEVLIMDEPTRGIDVGAKAEIYRLMGKLAKQGKAIIMVSSDLPELMGVSDRIHVVREGQIVAEYQRNEFDQERIMASAFGLS